MDDATKIEDAVRRHYAQAAQTASACCSVPEGFGPDGAEVYGAARYDSSDLDGLPAEAVAASIGCANPVALAELRHARRAAVPTRDSRGTNTHPTLRPRPDPRRRLLRL